MPQQGAAVTAPSAGGPPQAQEGPAVSTRIDGGNCQSIGTSPQEQPPAAAEGTGGAPPAGSAQEQAPAGAGIVRAVPAWSTPAQQIPAAAADAACISRGTAARIPGSAALRHFRSRRAFAITKSALPSLRSSPLTSPR